jgi:hypothetical protein
LGDFYWSLYFFDVVWFCSGGVVYFVIELYAGVITRRVLASSFDFAGVGLLFGVAHDFDDQIR